MTQYEYDANGNLVKETSTDAKGKVSVMTYTYDFENRLLRRSRPVGGGNLVETFIYDYEGNLLRNETMEGTFGYVYGGGPAPLVRMTNPGQGIPSEAHVNYIQVNGRTVGSLTAGGVKSKDRQYYHSDALGSVIAVTDGKAKVVRKTEYDPYGNILSDSGSVTVAYEFVGAYGVRKSFDGQSIMGVRIYDSNIGRFTAQDPLGFGAGDLNLYRYTGNNPVNLIDPTGKKMFNLTIAGGGGISRARRAAATDVFNAFIKDTLCGDVTNYTVIALGVGIGIPSLTGISQTTFEWSDSSRSWSFEGTGRIWGIHVRLGSIGFDALSGMQIPNGPYLSDLFSFNASGGFSGEISHFFLADWVKN